MDDDTKRKQEALRRLRLGYDRVDLGEPDPLLQRRSKKKTDDTAMTSDREITLSLPTSWDFLKAWLNRYAVGHPITGVNNLNFKSRQTRALMNGMEFKATIEGAYQSDIVVPLFEFAVFARHARCDVTTRCNEPSLIGCYRGLLLAIVEQWPEESEVVSKYVAGLPEMQATEDQTSKQHAKAAPKKPRVPGRLRDLNKWRACWRKIKPEWKRGKPYYEIRQWLNAQDSDLEYSEDVLAEIIKAGEAGLLDQDSPKSPDNSR